MSSWFQGYGFADVFDDLLVGAYPLDERDVGTLSSMGVKRVLNLAEDREYKAGERETVVRALADARIEERRMGLTDFGTLPPDVVEASVQIVSRWLDRQLRIYLHCRAGWQRSAAVAAGVVALRRGIDIDDAVSYVQARKPSADPLPHQRDDLRRWWSLRTEAML